MRLIVKCWTLIIGREKSSIAISKFGTVLHEARIHEVSCLINSKADVLYILSLIGFPLRKLEGWLIVLTYLHLSEFPLQ